MVLRQNRGKLLMIMVGLGLLIGLFVNLAAATSGQAASPPPPKLQILERGALEVGDVIAQGRHISSEECEFDAFKVGTTVSDSDKTKWLALRVNEWCQVIITAKWQGRLWT